MEILGRMSASDSIHVASLLVLPPCGPRYWPQHALALNFLSAGDWHSGPLDIVRTSHEEPEMALLLAEVIYRMLSELVVMALRKDDRIVAGGVVYVLTAVAEHTPEVGLELRKPLVPPK